MERHRFRVDLGGRPRGNRNHLRVLSAAADSDQGHRFLPWLPCRFHRLRALCVGTARCSARRRAVCARPVVFLRDRYDRWNFLRHCGIGDRNRSRPAVGTVSPIPARGTIAASRCSGNSSREPGATAAPPRYAGVCPTSRSRRKNPHGSPVYPRHHRAGFHRVPDQHRRNGHCRHNERAVLER